MTDVTYQKFVKRWEEVMEVPTQSVGPLTPLYKRVVRRLKVMPWPVLILVAAMVVVGLYVAFGSAITLFVNVLQRGF